MKSVFGERLIELRKEKGLSQNDLSAKTDLSQSAISRWENGEREPTASALYILAMFFEKSADYLIGIEDEFGNKLYEKQQN